MPSYNHCVPNNTDIMTISKTKKEEVQKRKAREKKTRQRLKIPDEKKQLKVQQTKERMQRL